MKSVECMVQSVEYRACGVECVYCIEGVEGGTGQGKGVGCGLRNEVDIQCANKLNKLTELSNVY